MLLRAARAFKCGNALSAMMSVRWFFLCHIHPHPSLQPTKSSGLCTLGFQKRLLCAVHQLDMQAFVYCTAALSLSLCWEDKIKENWA